MKQFTTATQLQNQNQSIVASSTSSAQTKSNSTITTTTTREQPKSTRFQKLTQQVPSNFNHEKHCVSCYASGESAGKYKDLRGKFYQTHTSNTCLWKRLKAQQMHPQDIETKYKERYDPNYQLKPHSSDRHYPRDRDSYNRYNHSSRPLPSEYHPQGNHTYVSNHDNRDPSPTHSTYSKRSYKSDNEDREQPHFKYQRQDYSDSRHRSPSPSPNYHDNRYSRS
jgi:hypothetical protein